MSLGLQIAYLPFALSPDLIEKKKKKNRNFFLLILKMSQPSILKDVYMFFFVVCLFS